MIPVVRISILLIIGMLLNERVESSELVQVALSDVYSIALPTETIARKPDGSTIAVLATTDEADNFADVVQSTLSDEGDVWLYPDPLQENRRIELGVVESAEYADNINSMTRLDFLMHMTRMQQVFLADLNEKPGQHAADANTVVFHNKYRGMMFFSMTKLSDEIRKRLIFDIFREGKMYSATFYWTSSSMDDEDRLILEILDSLDVAP